MSDTPRTLTLAELIAHQCTVIPLLTTFAFEKDEKEIEIECEILAVLERHDALVAALETHDRWLVERVQWLTNEAHSGGNWEHLNARRTEASYALEKFRALVKAAKPGDITPTHNHQ